ncbi:MAG: nucleotidyltransferase family protein [Sulfurimonadaceae bacterium]|jgi:hypothetical protein
MNKEEIITFLKRQQPYFYENFGVKFVGLFGSFARDEQKVQSDIDILYDVEKNRKLSIFKYLELAKKLEDSFHTKIDLVRVDTLKPQIKKYVDKDIIYV